MNSQTLILPVEIRILVDTEELQLEPGQNVSHHQPQDVVEKPEKITLAQIKNNKVSRS